MDGWTMRHVRHRVETEMLSLLNIFSQDKQIAVTQCTLKHMYRVRRKKTEKCFRLVLLTECSHEDLGSSTNLSRRYLLASQQVQYQRLCQCLVFSHINWHQTACPTYKHAHAVIVGNQTHETQFMTEDYRSAEVW